MSGDNSSAIDSAADHPDSRKFLDYTPLCSDFVLSDNAVCIHYPSIIVAQEHHAPQPVRKHAMCCSASVVCFDRSYTAPLNGYQAGTAVHEGIEYPYFLVWPVIHSRRPVGHALLAPHLWPGTARTIRDKTFYDQQTGVYIALALATGHLPGLEEAGPAGQKFIMQLIKHHPSAEVAEPSIPRNEPISAESVTQRQLRHGISTNRQRDDPGLLSCFPFPILKYLNLV